MAFSRSGGALVWRRCLRRSLSLSLVLLSWWRSRRRVEARAPSQFLGCLCSRVWAYHLLFLCPRASGLCVWWRWCALRWRVAPFSRFRGVGCPSYHRFFPHGLPIRYSLIPLMFRSSVLAASCSLCVLWRWAHFLWRWWLPPALMAYGERGGFHGAFSVGGCAGVAALCTSFS